MDTIWGKVPRWEFLATVWKWRLWNTLNNSSLVPDQSSFKEGGGRKSKYFPYGYLSPSKESIASDLREIPAASASILCYLFWFYDKYTTAYPFVWHKYFYRLVHVASVLLHAYFEIPKRVAPWGVFPPFGQQNRQPTIHSKARMLQASLEEKIVWSLGGFIYTCWSKHFPPLLLLAQ